MILVLSLVTTLALAADTGTRLDPSLVETELVRQGIALQALEAERDALRAQCAKACVSVVTPAPAPKATPKPAPKPAPKATTPVAPVAPKAVVTPVAPTVPDPRIAELEEEIAFLRGQLAKPAPSIVVNPTPVQVNVMVPQAAAPDVIVNPTVERTLHTEHTETVVVTGTRFHLGITEMGTMAPPLPGASSWVSDRTELFGRYEWAVSRKAWIGLEVDGGYGFAAGSTSIRALPTLTVNLGGGTDLNVAVGASYLCESAFTGGPLCSATRTGGQAQVGIAQQLGPVAGELFVGGGYDMVDSSVAGIGGVGHGYAGIRFYAGRVGQDTTVTVH